jgi:hypothetical protein
MTGNPLLVCHVPKTAGTALKQLVRQLAPDTCFAYDRQLSLVDPDLDFIAGFRTCPTPSVVMGHFSFGVHRFLRVPPRYAIVLREPVARVISLYRYQLSLADSPFAGHFREDPSLLGFVTSGITEMTNNHMCRIVAGVAPDVGKVIQGSWLLDCALHNLERFFGLVGLHERIDDFTAGLCRTMHWPDAPLTRQNVTDGEYPVMDGATMELLLERNALDIALYAHVRASLAPGQLPQG